MAESVRIWKRSRQSISGMAVQTRSLEAALRHMGSLTHCALALSLAYSLLSAAPARACFFKPFCAIESLPEQGKSIPANIKTLGIRLCTYGMPTPSVALMVERDGKSTVIDVEVEEATQLWGYMDMREQLSRPLSFWLLHLRGSLRPGDKLVLRFREPMLDDADAGFNEGEMSWPVGDEAAVPEQLGKLDIHQDAGAVRIAHNSSCSRKILSSYAEVALLPAADARPWLDALRYELRVDGREHWVFYGDLSDLGKHFWTSSLGPGKDRLVVGCEAHPLSVGSLNGNRMQPVLVPGEHRVRMVGILPDGTELSSEEVVLDMQCPPGTSGPIFDAGVPDAGSIFASNDNVQEVSPPPDESSCAVQAPGHSPRQWSAWLLLAACVLWRRRPAAVCRSSQ
jgi:hypothetical protein